jgi:hypothetical protein
MIDSMQHVGTLSFRDLAQAAASRLLQLPAAAVDLVLQQLDQCSLASLTESCSTLRETVTAHVSKIVVHYSSLEAYNSFILWTGANNSSLTRLTQCSIVDSGGSSTPRFSLYALPCPHLKQLHVQQVGLEVGPGGFLKDCKGLTALHLQDCGLTVGETALADIAAALPELQHSCYALQQTRQLLCLCITGCDTRNPKLSNGQRPLRTLS